MASHTDSPGSAWTLPPSDDGGTRCWRCGDPLDDPRTVAHPDPTVDGEVPVCPTECWLPDAVSYRCHDCAETYDRQAIRLVWLPSRGAMVPECLDCHR
ncbi:MAG: hypothetical protein ABEJ30_06120 [Halorientalis sp.]